MIDDSGINMYQHVLTNGENIYFNIIDLHY